MADRLVLSIDGMGGDHGPDTIVAGIERLAARQSDVRILLHGDKAKLEAALAAHPAAAAIAEVRAAEGEIGMDVKPSQALRQGRGTSLWNAVASVESGEAHAVVSAGNTGAFMAIAMFRLRMMEGVHRPALAARWPTMKGGYVAVLDVGANVEASAEQLVEFAIMGEAFQRAVSGQARPSVGLLNVGSEDLKGHEEIRGAARLVRAAGVDMAFHGFVEGDDIAKGTVDVVVTDGFTGNIALKTAEGTARMAKGFLREALGGSVLARLGAMLAYGALKNLMDKMDPGNSNGAVFLGLNGLVVKSHGSADARSFAAALDVAARMATSHYREEIAANLQRLAASQAAGAAPAEAEVRNAP